MTPIPSLEEAVEAAIEMAGDEWLDPQVDPSLGWADVPTKVFAQAALQAIHDEGYVVVPREPTEAMLDAGYDAMDSTTLTKASSAYRAMIQAAQETGEGG